MSNNQIYAEVIRQLLDQEILTIVDGQLYLDGELIGSGPAEESEYRPDGWSHETSRGCRRHRLIDTRLDALENGDATEQALAKRFARWYCFDPMQLAGFKDERKWREANPPPHSIEAEDDAERLMAGEAALMLGNYYWLGALRNDVDLFYPVAEDTDGDGTPEHRSISTHRVVIAADSPVEEIVNRFPEQQVAHIERALVRFRNP